MHTKGRTPSDTENGTLKPAKSLTIASAIENHKDAKTQKSNSKCNRKIKEEIEDVEGDKKKCMDCLFIEQSYENHEGVFCLSEFTVLGHLMKTS